MKKWTEKEVNEYLLESGYSPEIVNTVPFKEKIYMAQEEMEYQLENGRET